MTEAFVNPEILTWARERAGLEMDGMAARIGTRTEKVEAWESGELRPTFRQAQKFAAVSHVPFGYLYLERPPEEELPIADFRTIGDRPIEPLGLEFRQVLDDVLLKQSWYREFRLTHNESVLPFVGRFNQQVSVTELVRDIRATLNLTDIERARCANWEEFLKLLTEKIEAAGVLVMRSGIVGTNTHRPLSVDEFRGFVISDSFAPVIFLNGKDARAAQIFTLIHELAHIWIGASGVSNEALNDDQNANDVDIEKLCNATAAEFLVPAATLHQRWSGQTTLEEQAKTLSRFFKVSTVVIARRAAETGLIAWAHFFEFYNQERAAWRNLRDQESGGGDFFRNSAVRNSKTFTKAVLATAYEGRLLIRDAGQLLGVAPSKLKKLAASVYGE